MTMWPSMRARGLVWCWAGYASEQGQGTLIFPKVNRRLDWQVYGCIKNWKLSDRNMGASTGIDRNLGEHDNGCEDSVLSAQCTVSQCSVHPHMHCHVMHSAASRLPQSQSESSSKSPSTSGLSPSPSCASSKSKNRQSMRIVLPSASVAKTIEQNTNPAMFGLWTHPILPRT